MITEIWLIRHGQSEGNANDTFQGQNDSHLSELGRRQATALAERMRDAGPFHAIYTSDLSRARETARPTAQIFGLPINEVVGLREVDVGLWGGLTAAQIASQFPNEWQAWQRYDTSLKRGGAESYLELQERVATTVEGLVMQHPGQRIILVFHGAAIKSYIAYLLRLPLNEMWRLTIDNASITRFRLDTGFLESTHLVPGRLLVLNDTCHLEALQ